MSLASSAWHWVLLGYSRLTRRRIPTASSMRHFSINILAFLNNAFSLFGSIFSTYKPEMMSIHSRNNARQTNIERLIISAATSRYSYYVGVFQCRRKQQELFTIYNEWNKGVYVLESGSSAKILFLSFSCVKDIFVKNEIT